MMLFTGLESRGQCSITIPSETTLIDGNDYDFQSGDVICLEAGEKPYLLIRNIDPEGNFDQPVTIRNHNGEVTFDTDHYYGISFWNCNNIVLSGKGDDDYTYGIKILKVANGTGLSIDNLSSKAEVRGIEISNTAFAGLMAKTDPFCEDGQIKGTRGDFIQEDIVIHDNYIHHTGTEGMYIGSSKYLQGFDVECNGDTLHVLPHVNSGVQVYDNRVEYTGWDGIQVSSAVEDCAIYGNNINHDSEEAVDFQMSGILIGTGSVCDCYNNKIIDGKGDGMDILGAGNQKIYNNLIVNAGQSFDEGANQHKHGIFCDHRYTPDESYMHYYNNTIIQPRTYGISHRNEELESSRAYNNVVINPGGYEDEGEDAYIHLSSESIPMDKKNNYFDQNVNSAGFDQPGNYDFDLQVNSPLVNAGRTIDEMSFDIENRTRPHAGGMDIGAYECHKPGVGIEEYDNDRRVKVFPNPVHFRLTIEAHLYQPADGSLTVFNVMGNTVFSTTLREQKREHKWVIPVSHWPSGSYFYKLETMNEQWRGKFFKH
ncbi:MAG: right-handed parallel beta-helix repeat-containing protein [Bacteroidales bacterium]|nr:right-handed parallel beta-helix repeat-containing protein [Bacteroidales bacterium]MCF8336518.1 right-handed parallel beta-helix repeat-containing protein [Bacteroidales bacterium]